MTFPATVRKAIADRQPPRLRGMKTGSATTTIVVRLVVDPARIRNLGGRDRQINLTAKEQTCLQPFQTTLFGNKDARRIAKLIINRRRAWLLSITSTGILVFTFTKAKGY